MAMTEAEARENTDKELWRKVPGDFYSPSLHVTEGGGIGINVHGSVYVKSLEEWHRLAGGKLPGIQQEAEAREWAREMADKLLPCDESLSNLKRLCPCNYRGEIQAALLDTYAKGQADGKGDWATGLCSRHREPDPLCGVCNPEIAKREQELAEARAAVERLRQDPAGWLPNLLRDIKDLRDKHESWLIDANKELAEARAGKVWLCAEKDRLLAALGEANLVSSALCARLERAEAIMVAARGVHCDWVATCAEYPVNLGQAGNLHPLGPAIAWASFRELDKALAAEPESDACPRCGGSFEDTGGKPAKPPYVCQKCCMED